MRAGSAAQPARSPERPADGERFLAEVRGPALALAAAASRLGAPVGIAGTVRVTAAASLAPTLLRALESLLERHPVLRVELAFDDHFADIGGGRWDLAVRIAPRIAEMVSVKLV